ncbi:MAG: MBL fold metallo-hydrolase [Pseudomonadota bacterium]|nr:MBL fold metallo-hydrolase [Pseudomonadota bacterium]
MQRFFSILTGLILTISVASAAALPAPKVVKVNARIHALLGPMELPNKKNQGYMVNSILIVGDTGAILIDTGFTDEIGAMLAKQVAKLTSKPVTHVINTHHHGDHSLGNIAFPNAKILSSEQCRKLALEHGADWIAIVEAAAGRKFPNTKVVTASVTYPQNSKSELVIDGVKMVFWVPEAAHTLGDMMIWLPDDQVLLSGDIMVNQITPNFRDANLKEWINALREVQSLPVKTIVPGHGPLMSKQDAAAMHQRMTSLYDGIAAGIKAGLTDSEIRNKLDLKEWKKLHHFDEQMGGNINKAYLEIEAASF